MFTSNFKVVSKNAYIDLEHYMEINSTGIIKEYDISMKMGLLLEALLWKDGMVDEIKRAYRFRDKFESSEISSMIKEDTNERSKCIWITTSTICDFDQYFDKDNDYAEMKKIINKYDIARYFYGSEDIYSKVSKEYNNLRNTLIDHIRNNNTEVYFTVNK